MTTEEMIKDFQDQLKKIVDEIRDLDSQINSKKEQYFRLQGAVEALTLTQKESEPLEDTSGPEDK
jgi:peptidoglycan hydrolase CwlO-like protein